MNSKGKTIAIISAILLLPALFLATSGILLVAFRIDAANHLLESLMGHTATRLLLSPLVVLGGPLVAFALNAWRIFHLSADVVNEEFVIALSVKRLFSHLLCLVLAGGLMLLLLAYAFVENFQIVAR